MPSHGRVVCFEPEALDNAVAAFVERTSFQRYYGNARNLMPTDVYIGRSMGIPREERTETVRDESVSPRAQPERHPAPCVHTRNADGCFLRASSGSVHPGMQNAPHGRR